MKLNTKSFVISALSVLVVASAGYGIAFGYGYGGGPSLPAPSNLVAQASFSRQINLSWTDNSTTENGFRIERKYGNCSNSTSFKQIARVGANATSFANKNLINDMKYCYRVRAYNSADNSNYSNESAAFASANPTPALPTDISAKAVSTSGINISWKDNSVNEKGFWIYRASGACSSSSVFGFVKQVSASTTLYRDRGLASDATYCYRLRVFNDNGVSTFSGRDDATTLANPVASLTAPSNLLANAVSTNRINLSWADNSTSESGFKIERKYGNCSNSTPFRQITKVGANITSFANRNLVDDMKYCYRVRAYNSTDNSNYSNESADTTEKKLLDSLLGLFN